MTFYINEDFIIDMTDENNEKAYYYYEFLFQFLNNTLNNRDQFE